MWCYKTKSAISISGEKKTHNHKLGAGIIGITVIAVVILAGVIDPNLIAKLNPESNPTFSFGKANASHSIQWQERPKWEKRRLSQYAQQHLQIWVPELETSHPQSIALVQERSAEIKTLLQRLQITYGNPEERSKAPLIKQQIRHQEQLLLQDIEVLLAASPLVVEKLMMAQR